MRILIHDFGAYGFIVQLTRWLARRGHMVLHLHCADLAGPQGATQRQPGDPSGLRFDALSVGRRFSRYALHRRIPDELRYGYRLGRAIADWRPDIVLSANTPPLAQAMALRAARRQGTPFVNWVQDIFAEGAGTLAARLPRPIGELALALLRRIEYGAMRGSDAVIVISHDFYDRLRRNGLDHPLLLVQENWAASLPPAPAASDWAAGQGLADRRLLLAAGTLGLKHDPGLLADLAQELAGDPVVRVVVVSQGPGRDHLEAWRRGRDAPLHLLDYQPADEVPAMLAAAEIGVVLLTAAAGAMSVPSKVYTYAAAGLPILAAIPAGNHAARLITARGLGLVVAPEDRAGFVAAARRLLADPDLRDRCAAAGRAFSARHGDIDAIGNRFERHLSLTIAARPPAPSPLPGLPSGPERDLLCALALRPPGPPPTAVDTGRLLALAGEHRLVPLLAGGWRACGLPPDGGLTHALLPQTRHMLGLGALLLEVMAALDTRGIRALALKGPALSVLLHGDPYLRPCGDIDLLVDPDQAAAAAGVLEERGFAPLLATPIGSLLATNKDAPYRRKGLLVELHWRLFDNPHLLDWPFEALWGERALVRLGQGTIPTLSMRHYGVYLTLHGVRHGWQRLRWLVDVALLLADPARGREIFMQAAADRMEPALAHAAILSRDMLGLSLPAPCDGWRVRALGRAAGGLSGALHQPDAGLANWLWRRLLERVIDLLLCPDRRALAMELRALLRGPGDVQGPSLPQLLFWLRPLSGPFRRLRRVWRRRGGPSS